MICPNCKASHGCGCQARTASNGASVCSKCINNYEATLKNRTVTTPQTAKVFYNPPK